jgi:hypothetical protein
LSRAHASAYTGGRARITESTNGNIDIGSYLQSASTIETF